MACRMTFVTFGRDLKTWRAEAVPFRDAALSVAVPVAASAFGGLATGYCSAGFQPAKMQYQRTRRLIISLLGSTMSA